MDNQRLLTWAFFGLMLWITYQTWVQDYSPRPVPPVSEQPGLAVEDPAAPAIDDDLPEIADPAAAAPETPDSDALEPVSALAAPVVRVTTDVLDLEISTGGGTLHKAVLRKYPVAKDRPDELVSLLSYFPLDLGLIESGVRAVGGAAEATHLTIFDSQRDRYELNGADELVVPLTWTDASGVVVEKRYRFRQGSYIIELEQEITNGSAELWRGADYVRIKRYSKEPERSMFDVDSYSFQGPIVYDGEKSEKLDRDDLLDDGKYEYYSQQGWFGSIQHHFVSAVVPPAGTEYRYEVSVDGNVATSSAIGRSAVAVAPGSSKVFATSLFVGPKLQAQLEEIDETLKLTVDYGWLTIISQPLFWLLSIVYGWVANWGVAIIVVTILIKLAFSPWSGRSTP